MNWLKSHVRTVGIGIIAIVINISIWILKPEVNIPSWTLVVAIGIIALLSELLFNEIQEKRESSTVPNRILAIRKDGSDRPVIIIRPTGNIQKGDVMSLFRRSSDFEEFTALCIVYNVQANGLVALSFLRSTFTPSEQQKIDVLDNTVISSWVVYTRVPYDSITFN
jgi:hypothetical protein